MDQFHGAQVDQFRSDRSTFNVTVLAQPVDVTCSVANGSGTVDAANIDSIEVSCAQNAYAVQAVVSGLEGMLVLQNNGAGELPVTSNGSTPFPTALLPGAAYGVTVVSQPLYQTCTVLNGTGLVAAAAPVVNVTCATDPAKLPQMLYLASHHGIAAVAMDSITGALQPLETAPGSFSYSSAALHPTGKFMFATNESNGGEVRTYQVTAHNGALTSPTTVAASADSNTSSAVAVRPDGAFLYVSTNRTAGTSISRFAIDADSGALSLHSETVVGTSSGFIPKLAAHPNGQFLYATEWATNKVHAYALDATTGALTAVQGSPFAVGTSPHAFAFNPAGTRLYVSHNNTRNVHAFDIQANGSLVAVAGNPFPAESNAPGLAFHPSGKFLFAAVLATTPNVAPMVVDATTGALSASTATTGVLEDFPTQRAVDPSGRFAFATVKNNNTVAGFSIDAATGGLTQLSTRRMWKGYSQNLFFAPPIAPLRKEGRFLYVAQADGIRVHTLNSTGTPTAQGTHTADGAAHALAVHPTRQVLYAITGANRVLTAYSIHPDTGALTSLGTVSDSNSTHLLVGPNGAKLLTVNNTSGWQLRSYDIAADTGALSTGGATDSLSGEVRGLAVTPVQRRVFVSNEQTASGGSADSIRMLEWDPSAAAPNNASTVALGFGATGAVAVHPSGLFAYVPAAGALHRYEISVTAGTLSSLGTTTTGGTGAATAAMDPWGRFVFVANASSNNVSVYAVNGTTGALLEVDGSPFPAGTAPTQLALDRAGQFLFVLNSGSSSVSAYAIRPDTGALVNVATVPVGASAASIAVAGSTN